MSQDLTRGFVMFWMAQEGRIQAALGSVLPAPRVLHASPVKAQLLFQRNFAKAKEPHRVQNPKILPAPGSSSGPTVATRWRQSGSADTCHYYHRTQRPRIAVSLWTHKCWHENTKLIAFVVVCDNNKAAHRLSGAMEMVPVSISAQVSEWDDHYCAQSLRANNLWFVEKPCVKWKRQGVFMAGIRTGSFFLLLSFLLSCMTGNLVEGRRGWMDENLWRKLTHNYSKESPPNAENPTRLHVQFIFLHLTLDETQMLLGVSMYFRQYWSDPRLRFDHLKKTAGSVRLASKYFHQVWLSDIFFRWRIEFSRFSSFWFLACSKLFNLFLLSCLGILPGLCLQTIWLTPLFCWTAMQKDSKK